MNFLFLITSQSTTKLLWDYAKFSAFAKKLILAGSHVLKG